MRSAAAALLLAAAGACRAADVPADCGDAPPPDQLLHAINALRAAGACAAEPAPPLAWSETLAHSAGEQASGMARDGRLAHDARERPLAERLREAGYRYRLAAENLAAGPATAAQLIALWRSSAPHCANLMNGALREAGLACRRDARSQRPYWALLLGTAR